MVVVIESSPSIHFSNFEEVAHESDVTLFANPKQTGKIVVIVIRWRIYARRPKSRVSEERRRVASAFKITGMHVRVPATPCVL